jgi:hypothetical protein
MAARPLRVGLLGAARIAPAALVLPASRRSDILRVRGREDWDETVPGETTYDYQVRAFLTDADPAADQRNGCDCEHGGHRCDVLGGRVARPQSDQLRPAPTVVGTRPATAQSPAP